MSHAYKKDDVLKIINSVIEKVGKGGETSKDAIYRELSELQAIIQETRQGMNVPEAADITDKHIPVATDELDAVIESTAEATGAIMDACEVIEDRAAQIGGEQGDAIAAQITKIYEACSFQDITGQRITKVVGALKSIEIKVGALMGVLEQGSNDRIAAAKAATEEDGDSLLNGPQLPGGGISQADIDKLLEDF
jgi:chemotaxis protein CheZ